MVTMISETIGNSTILISELEKVNAKIDDFENRLVAIEGKSQ